MFQLLLGVPEFRVGATLFQQRGVGARLGHPAVLQQADPVGGGDVGQPVGDEVRASVRISAMMSFSLSTSMLEVASSKR